MAPEDDTADDVPVDRESYEAWANEREGSPTSVMVIRCAGCKQETSRPGQWLDPDTFVCSIECKGTVMRRSKDTELADAIKLANRVLDRVSGDPDDDLAVLSRQLLRSREIVDKQEAEIKRHYQTEYDPYADLIEANRDAMLRMHEEAVRRIGGTLTGGGPNHDKEKLLYIGRVLHALSLFHPMHGESWKGFPDV